MKWLPVDHSQIQKAGSGACLFGAQMFALSTTLYPGETCSIASQYVPLVKQPHGVGAWEEDGLCPPKAARGK